MPEATPSSCVSCPPVGRDSTLSQRQWHALHTQLRERLAALGEVAFPSEGGCAATEPADQAEREEAVEAWLARRHRTDAERRAVERALVRMEQGTYGVCEETGEPIGWARLQACPTATVSLEAQERRERRARAFTAS